MELPPITETEAGYRVEGNITMTADEVTAILTGRDADRITTDDPGWIASIDDAMPCATCGAMIGHGPQHYRFHAALAILAALVQGTENEPARGRLSDDDQREADACATGDAG